jgi:hypothetical protein
MFRQPTMVLTTLIPFGDRIIYDSLMRSYPVVFGRGAVAAFKQTLSTAKKNGRFFAQIPNAL